MQIILICQYETGSIACNADRIDGIPVNERHYYIDDYQVVLEGDESVVHHDVDELLSMDGAYRLPTLKEQNAIAKAKQDASSVQEQGPAGPATDTAPVQPPQAPDTVKTADSKPKNGG